jgi:hypothetical protein
VLQCLLDDLMAMHKIESAWQSVIGIIVGIEQKADPRHRGRHLFEKPSALQKGCESIRRRRLAPLFALARPMNGDLSGNR